MNQAASRLVWLDGFRGVAVISMVWVHVANTFLAVSLQETEWFARWTFFHGLVAPAFFWIAGFGRGLGASSGRVPGWRVVWRLGGMMVLGYLMHLPLMQILGGAMDAAAWREMWKVDVLQTLALTGLLLVMVERWVVSVWWRRAAYGVLMLAFVLPAEMAAGWATGMAPVDAWLNRATGSLFPLFPWVGFGLAGWLCGSWYGEDRKALPWLGGVGLVLALVLPDLGWPGEPMRFFLQRLGWVLMGAVPLAVGMEWLSRRARWSVRWVLLAGVESLLMYVAHLFLIYALPMDGRPLAKVVGPTQTVPQVVAWFGLLTAVSLGLAWLNERRKQKAWRRAQAGSVFGGDSKRVDGVEAVS